MHYLEHLEEFTHQKRLSPDLAQILRDLFYSYLREIQGINGDTDAVDALFKRHLHFMEDQVKTPYLFPSYHRAFRSPVDYLQFGIDFIEPLVIKEESFIKNRFRVDEMQAQVAKGENVILFGNHQIEPDPQAILLMLRDTHPEFAENMIFVAGHRVTTDPFAIPFSMGCNLLCIYSKKHIEFPPDKKQEKLQHNQRTMNAMKELLAGGGKCIYVAPSGGRDRPNESGDIVVSSFDPQSIEMFRLVAKQSKRPAHFYPLALSTFHLMPPPKKLEKNLSESRSVHRTPLKLCFGEELHLDEMPGLEGLDKHQCREVRAKAIWNIVSNDFHTL